MRIAAIPAEVRHERLETAKIANTMSKKADGELMRTVRPTGSLAAVSFLSVPFQNPKSTRDEGC